MTTTDLQTDAAAWIYAGELTDQLGPRAACIVGQHIQSMSGSSDFASMVKWLSVLDKVATLLQGPHGIRH